MTIIDEPLLQEFREQPRCSWCGHPNEGRPMEPHHIFARGRGFRMDLRINLVGLCLECHAAIHTGGRPLRCDLLAVVAAREGLLQDDIRCVLSRLRLMPKGSDPAPILADLRRQG